MADFNKEKKDAQAQQEIIDAIPGTVKTAEKAAVAKSEAIAKRQFETEKKFYQLEKDNEIAKLTAEKENLTQSLVDFKTKETTLTTKLDDAYKELKELAGETVKGAQNSEMFDKMKTMLDGKSK
jgi:seryl-tRNA synthetase